MKNNSGFLINQNFFCFIQIGAPEPIMTQIITQMLYATVKNVLKK